LTISQVQTTDNFWQTDQSRFPAAGLTFNRYERKTISTFHEVPTVPGGRAAAREARDSFEPRKRRQRRQSVACGCGPDAGTLPAAMTPLISRKVAAAINAQVGMEFLASLQYEAIAAWFKLEGLPRLQAHFARQAEEEREHAHRFIKFLLDAGVGLDLPAIPAPKCKFKSAIEAVELALDHELKVTDSIKQLLNLAEKEQDRFTQNSLQWFINEQLEEVSSVDELLQMVRRAGDGGLLYVEHYLASTGGRKKEAKD
jgi:ferritin